jgi:hypothetical protein
MPYIGNVDRVYRYMGSGICQYGVLYAFDEALVIAWLGTVQGGMWGGFAGSPPDLPPALLELGALPKHSIAPEAVAERNADTFIVPTAQIKSAVLRRSKLTGAPFRPSSVKLMLVSGKDAAFLAQRHVTRPVAELLQALLDGRFQNCRRM